MPTVCRFLDIEVFLHYRGEHNPPHIHVAGPDFVAAVAIADGLVIRGELPRKYRSIVREWVKTENQALMENWERVINLMPVMPVRPPQL